MKSFLRKAFCSVFLLVIAAAASNTCRAAGQSAAARADRAETLISALTGAEFSQYEPCRNVTRLEFTTELVRLLKAENSAEVSGEFNDAKTLQPVYDALSIGLISKGSSFRPNDEITFSEAVKMTVSAIGCDIIAQRYGGYPQGYIKAAAEKDLLKNLSRTYEKLSSDDMCILLYNMLMATDFHSDEIKGSSLYYSESSDPFIYRLYGVKSVKGIITKTHSNSYNSEYRTGSRKTIAVNGEEFVSENDWDEFFGMKCSVYYYADNSDLNVLTVLPEENNAVTVSLSDDVTVEGETLKVTGGGKTVKYALKKGYIYVYNGKTENRRIGAELSGDGYITLIDNNGDSTYDAVFMNKASYIVVKSIDIGNRVISDVNSSENDVSFDEQKVKCKIKSSEGVLLNPIDIKPESALEVYRSSDGSVVSLIVPGSEINGKITAFDSSENSYEIGEEFHKLTAYAKKYYSDKIAVGKNVNYVTDMRGSIVYAKSEDSRFYYGFVIKAAQEGRLNKSVMAKIFTDGGGILNFTLNDKITFDAAAKTPAESVLNNALEGCLIRYRTDKDGKISAIDTCETYNIAALDNSHFETPKNEENSLSRYLYPTSSFIYKSSGTASEYFNINGSKVMMVPSDITDEEKYDIKPYSQLPSGKAYTMEVYDVDEYGNAGIALIRGDIESFNETMNAYMVSSVRNSSLDSEWGLSLELWRNGVFDTFFLPSEIEYSMANGSSLKPGCIVRVVTEEKRIKKLIVDFDSATLNGNRSYDSRSAALNGGNQNITYQTGKVYRADNGFVMISNVSTGGVFDFSPVNLKNYSLGSVKIARYNSKTKLVETIGRNDINSFKQAGDSADYIVIKQDSYNTNGVYVFELE